jgi:hypothetical protein
MLHDDRAMSYVNFQARLLPDYREGPKLTESYVELFDRPARHVSCKWCGRNVVFEGVRWTHLAADGGLSVGCRAASFTADEGWNDSLSKNWKAQPAD